MFPIYICEPEIVDCTWKQIWFMVIVDLVIVGVVLYFFS